MDMANALAYNDMATITAINSFIVQALGVNVNTFYGRNLFNFVIT
jgi:hypothetical protein